MIIVDYSGIALASIIINKTNDEDMIRHMILNSLRMYHKRYKDEYGEMVLAVDAANNWRRSVFPQYKASRKKNRQESTFDWNEAFRLLNLVREEIAENFPYKVIRIDTCEADDIIGALVMKKSKVEFNPEKIMIVSSDRDFLQLQRFPNVKQFSPLLKKELIEDLEQGELLYAASWYRNYLRNEQLIALSETPQELKNEIINTYEKQDPWSNKSKVLPYLIAKRCNNLIESVQEFI